MGSLFAKQHKKPANDVSTKWVYALCISCFCMGVFIVNRFWTNGTISENEKDNISSREELGRVLRSHIHCENKKESISCANDSQISHTQDAIMRLDKAISRLQMQLAAARAAKESNDKYPIALEPSMDQSDNRPKVYYVMGIITAISSRKRRDSIRGTWMPSRDKLQKLEKERDSYAFCYRSQGNSEVHIQCKGAAEIVLASCTQWLDQNGSVQPMTSSQSNEFKKSIENIASISLRCVAFAYRLYN